MVWYHADMMEFPIAALLDDSICRIWLERHLHPKGLACPHCHRPARRLCRQPGDFPAYRCRACDGYYTLLTHTVFAQTRQRPATRVLLLRGMAKGDPTARFARELGMSRKQRHPWRQRVQTNLNTTAPADVRTGTACEADELDQHAGEKPHTPWRSQRPATATRQSAHRARPLGQRSAPDPQPHRA
jgi:hypothetical protein